MPAPPHARGKTQTRIAVMSEETAGKQKREHPELSVWEYSEAQRVVSEATIVHQDSPRSLVHILEAEQGGYILVVKATFTGRAIFVTSFRRLSRDQAIRDAAIKRLLARG